MSMERKRTPRHGLTIGLLCAAAAWCATAARAEHRVIEVGLQHTFTSGWSTPQWYQPHIRADYPVGCGPAAWAIVYGYWQAFHGQERLFENLNVGDHAGWAGVEEPAVSGAMERVAYHVETAYGDTRDDKWGLTWPAKMCQGIRYAQEKGYPHSRCLEITGTEFDKFDHVKRHLESDQPVVLAIRDDDNRGAINHYVVIERARKRQEKVGSDWHDRDVEYYINYGHQNRQRGWISARQVGRNTTPVTTVTHAYLIDVSATPLEHADNANEEACRTWCSGNAAECSMCSKLPGCGPGYRRIRDFTGAGPNWYACAARGTDRAQASEGNRRECEAWCHDNAGCEMCSTQLGCGVGYERMKSFTGPGNNWHACRKRAPSDFEQASDEHQRECDEWCRSHPECVKCSKLPGCGGGFYQLESWTGRGRNWFACGERQQASERNKADCEAWCAANPACAKCDTSFGCGIGYKHLKSFRGPGTNWHACEKR